jgi:hypothetical protein
MWDSLKYREFSEYKLLFSYCWKGRDKSIINNRKKFCREYNIVGKALEKKPSDLMKYMYYLIDESEYKNKLNNLEYFVDNNKNIIIVSSPCDTDIYSDEHYKMIKEGWIVVDNLYSYSSSMSYIKYF